MEVVLRLNGPKDAQDFCVGIDDDGNFLWPVRAQPSLFGSHFVRTEVGAGEKWRRNQLLSAMVFGVRCSVVCMAP